MSDRDAAKLIARLEKLEQVMSNLAMNPWVEWSARECIARALGWQTDRANKAVIVPGRDRRHIVGFRMSRG